MSPLYLNHNTLYQYITDPKPNPLISDLLWESCSKPLRGLPSFSPSTVACGLLLPRKPCKSSLPLQTGKESSMLHQGCRSHHTTYTNLTGTKGHHQNLNTDWRSLEHNRWKANSKWQTNQTNSCDMWMQQDRHATKSSLQIQQCTSGTSESCALGTGEAITCHEPSECKYREAYTTTTTLNQLWSQQQNGPCSGGSFYLDIQLKI